MNFKFLSALLLLSVFITACGDDDSAPSLNYPILATYAAITDQSEMQVFVNSGGTVSELSADMTSADEDSIFDDLSDGFTTTSYEFTSETELTIYDDDPFFGDTSIATMELRKDDFDIILSFGSLSIKLSCEGDPTDFFILSSAYNIDSPGGLDIAAAGPILETLDNLKASLAEGDTLAYLTYKMNYKE